MDIKNLNTNLSAGRLPEQVRTQERGNQQNAGQTTGNEPTDKVTLTGTLNQVRDLEQKAASVDVDNSDRIATLKAAIADDSYQVDTQKVAEKFIRSESLFSSL